MCLEDSHGNIRWIRVVKFDNSLFAIESTDYAILEQGYPMRFSNQTELSDWMSQQLATGWRMSFSTHQPSDSIDTNIIGRIQMNVFNALARK